MRAITKLLGEEMTAEVGFMEASNQTVVVETMVNVAVTDL